MYIEAVPNRNSPPAILLREGYREDGKVKKRTLANLSQWDPQLIEHFRVLLRGGVAVASAQELFTIERSLPHGHVAAVLGAARGIGIEAWFGAAPAPLQPLLLAMVVARVVSPASKLATHRMLHDDTATHSLGRVLGVGQVPPEQLYGALDWLHQAQPAIEQRLARKHLAGDTLVLYDLTSTWLTGRCCELAARGHSRDGKRDDPQIVFGLICTAQGCPIAVEVFPGNTADPPPWRHKWPSCASVSASSALPGWVIAACSPRRASSKSCALRPWTGSAACAPRRSRNWPLSTGRFSPRCSMSATSWNCRASTSQASGWWCAVTRCSPASGRASARNCWRPPKWTWPRSLWPADRANRCMVSRPSRFASDDCRSFPRG